MPRHEVEADRLAPSHLDGIHRRAAMNTYRYLIAALQFLEKNGPKDDLQQPLDPTRLHLIPSYIAEARDIACQSIRKCYDSGRRFVLLTTDGHGDGLSAALDVSGHRRVIRIIRDEAPIPGSRCTVSFPN
jgi:hypothetical protein